MGFTGEGNALSDVIYVWNYPKVEGRQITFNTITESFTMTTKIASPSAFFTDPPPASVDAINIAKEFITRMALMPKDLDETKTKITFLKFQNSAFVKTTSLSQSDVVQIDFYRKPVSNSFILYPNPEQSLLSFRIKNARDRDLEVIEAHYAYKQINMSNPSTYPIKSAQEAFEELKLGSGYIARETNTQGSIAIAKVYTAYYEGNDDSPYLLPIFVFEGNNGFLAFVEAVKAEWLQ